MEIVRLNVPDIDCQGCVLSIRLVVRQLNGTGEVNGDWKSGLVTVEYDPSAATVEAIQGALERIGYDSTVIES